MVRSVVIDRGMGGSVDLAPDLQTEVLEKERSLGGDHFAVLGIAPSATAEEIRAAYHAESRRFHPDRFFRQELGPFRAKLERIFRRLNEAHAVLSDPAKRAAYLAANPSLTASARPPPVDPARQDERRSRLARHPYLVTATRAREALAQARRLLGSAQASQAVELLNGLLKVEPRNAEAQALLVEARRVAELEAAQEALRSAERAEKEGRSADAIAAYQRALARGSPPASVVARANFRLAALLGEPGGPLELARAHAKTACELEPDNADHRALFARILVELGAKKLARKELDAALALSPKHREANLLLKKVRWSILGDKP